MMKRLLLLLALVGAAVPTFAQTGTLTPAPYLTVVDDSGGTISGACVWTYVAGTSTPATTWTDKAMATPNTNPVVANSIGQVVIYLQPGNSYKFIFEQACTPPAHGVVIRTRDGIDSVPATSAAVDVLGTAGEALGFDHVVYLSDGSGGKNAGQWYEAIATNPYSSTSPIIGMVPSAISAAAIGSIRIVGEIGGFSTGVAGSTYYISSAVAGIMTLTPPSLARAVGKFESATTIYIPAPQPYVDVWANDFRLSLTTATPVTTADVTGASAVTIFMVPFSGNRLDLPDANGNPIRTTTAQISIAVPATTSQTYDIFAYLSGATPTLELLAWTNDTTRATGVSRNNGRWTKTGDVTRLYLGSFRTTTVSGQTEDSLAKRYLWNYYNRVQRMMRVVDTTNSWPYSTAAYRQANGAAANQLDVVVGIAETMLDVTARSFAANTAGGGYSVSIGEDSTTTTKAGTLNAYVVFPATANAIVPATATLQLYPAVGRHTYVWLEYSDAVPTTTWYGDNGGTLVQAGIYGSIWG